MTRRFLWLTTLGWVVGTLIGYFGDFGPNGPGLGALIGLAVVPALLGLLLILLLIAPRAYDEEAMRKVAREEAEAAIASERQRQETADRRRRRNRNVARVAILLSGWVVGYLLGAIYHRSFVYPGIINWSGIAEGFFVTSLILLSDPEDELPV